MLEPKLFIYKKEVADYMGREIDPLNPEFHLSGGYVVDFPDFVEELDKFKALVTKEFSKNSNLPNTDFDWLFLGQHYGLLIPLVDFSIDLVNSSLFCYRWRASK